VADLPMSGTVPDEMKLLRAETAELRAETARLRTALAALQHTPPAGSALLTGLDRNRGRFPGEVVALGIVV